MLPIADSWSISPEKWKIKDRKRAVSQIDPRPIKQNLSWLLGFPGDASCKEPTCQCRRYKRQRFNPWMGKIPWRRKWQPTAIFCLGNPKDREAWWATVHRVAKSWTWLKQLSLQHTQWLLSVLRQRQPLLNYKISKAPWRCKNYNCI